MSPNIYYTGILVYVYRFVLGTVVAWHTTSNFISFRRLLEIARTKSIFSIFGYLVKLEPGRVFIFYPELTLLFVFILKQNYHLIYILPVIIVYLLTSTKWLNHWGESFRYIEYGLFFTIPFQLILTLQSFPEIQILSLSLYMGFIIQILAS